MTTEIASPETGSVNAVALGWFTFCFAHVLLGFGAGQLIIGAIGHDDATSLRGAVMLLASAVFFVATALCAQRPSEAR